MIGGDRGDRLADVAHDVGGEHRLVLADQPVEHRAGHVVGRDDRLDAGDLPRRRQVDRHDPRRTDAATATSLPTGSRRPTGRTRTRTSPAPWRCRRAGSATCRSCRRPSGSVPDRRCRSFDRASRSRPARRGATRDPLDRVDDPPVPRAAADVAGELLADLDLRWAPASRSSRSWTATISPGVQNPHCTAPASTNACWTSDGVPDRGTPSIVTIGLADGGGRHHEARTHQRAVDEDAARAALALLARALRAEQPEPVAQHVEQALAEPRIADRPCRRR